MAGIEFCIFHICYITSDLFNVFRSVVFAKTPLLDMTQLLKQKPVAAPPVNSASKGTENRIDNVRGDKAATRKGKFWMELRTSFDFNIDFFFYEFKVKTKKRRVVGPVLDPGSAMSFLCFFST